MSFAQVRTDIEDNFKTEWALTGATTVKYPNAPFPAPTDNASYVAFHILDGGERVVGNMGALSRYRQTGIVQVDIFTKAGTGTKPGRVLADQLATIFRAKRIGGAVFREPSVSADASMQQTSTSDQFSGSSNYWKTVFSIPFQYDKSL